VDDSDWEPDGTTLHVRFCEGGGPYRSIGMPAATLQIDEIDAKRSLVSSLL